MSIISESKNLECVLKENEERINNDFIKDESTKELSSKSKISLNDTILSTSLLTPLFSPSINEYTSFLSQSDNKSKFSLINFSQENLFYAFKSQINTKKLQKSLVGISKEIIDNIIENLSSNFRRAIKDKNGNYFCSSLIKICSKEQRYKIIKELSNTLCDDCIDAYGTHPIQNLIEFASSEEEFKLILSSFNDFTKILMASMNQYGTYVIQKIIVHIPESLRMEFNLIFVKFVCILARDIYGVVAAKKFIGNTKNEAIIKQISNLILTNFANLSQNKYGNYLIQYLLEKWWNKDEGAIFKFYIVSKFHFLLENNYSAYVCNLYLKLCSIEEKMFLFNSINNYQLKKNKALLDVNNAKKDIKLK